MTIKTAIIHEWFVNYAGSEKCVESFTNLYPEADVYALVDFLSEEQRQIILKGRKANTTFIQKLPFAKKGHRNYLPLFPKAIESFDLSNYDIILSSAHAVAKGVKKNNSQLHICYCHSPMRYAWDQSKQYLKGIRGLLAKQFMNHLREWDVKSSANVDFFIANSHHIAEKIKRIYQRDADVIYPPVDVDNFEPGSVKEDFYLTASRLVQYKRMDLVVEAFNNMPDKKLVVIGSGPERDKILTRASSNIKFLGHQQVHILKEYMQKAKAFVFAAEEDFGIIVVEAMACGTPVIALNQGGTAETVIDGTTGIHFKEQTSESIILAVKRFETLADSFSQKSIHEYSVKYSRQIFEDNIENFVREKYQSFRSNKNIKREN